MSVSDHEYDKDQILYCCILSQQIVAKLGVIQNRDHDEEIPSPVAWQGDLTYEILLARLPNFLRSISNDNELISRESFISRYGKMEYRTDESDEVKREVVITIVNLFEDIENVYFMAKLLSINAGISARERAVVANAIFSNDNGEQMDLLFTNEEEDEDDYYSSAYDSDFLEPSSTLQLPPSSTRKEVYVGDRKVDFKFLRVKCFYSEEYIVIKDSGKSDYLEARLMSNVTNCNFSNFINSFIYLGSYKESVFNDFNTLITMYAQDFATEVGDGSLKTKSNFRSTNQSRQKLKSTVSRAEIEQMNNGTSYWQTLSWFGISNFNLKEYKIWCEECFSKLIIYLDLLNDKPDDSTVLPDVVPNQNIVFRTIDIDVKVNDIRMAAASCELDKLFKKSLGMRDQIRSVVSYLMILTSNKFKVMQNDDGIRIIEWTLFPLSEYSTDNNFTNINYKHLYSILQILIALTV